MRSGPLPLHHAASIREAMLCRVPADLSPALRWVLAGLMLHADERGVARVTGPRLARMLGYSPRTVERQVRQLRALGLLGDVLRREVAPGAWQIGYPITLPPLPSPKREPAAPLVVDEAQRVADEVPF